MNPINELFPAAFSISAEGWCNDIARAPCTNFDARPLDAIISLLVIHNISLPPGQFGGEHIEALFANQLDYAAHPYFEQLRDLKVSAHFLVRRSGRALQFVATTERAWHAGLSQFEGRERCNDFSIGIELEGSDDQTFTDAQYQTLANLTSALASRHPLSHVAGHEHIAPGRKTDPGPFFDWQRYQAEFDALEKKSVSRLKSKRSLYFPV
jgi:AmpD protein